MRFKYFASIVIILSLLAGNFCFAQELIPNDVFFEKQWYLSKLNMPEVWQEETGKNSIAVAIIDSGVDIAHPDLRDNIWVNQDEILGDRIDNDENGYVDDINGWDFINNSNDPSPKYEKDCLLHKTCIKEAIFHGTFVAGIAAAVSNNNLGIAGMAWGVKIMPLRVLNQNGAGNTRDVIEAINYAIDNGADIINLSFVGDTYDRNLEQALQRAYENGLIIVAAAGNEDFEGHRINLNINKMYPVCHQGENGENIIIGVGASDKDYKLTKFSNYGSSCIDVIAPGDEFFGTIIYDSALEEFSEYYGGKFSGTSLAVPIISGLAALVKSAEPNLTNQEIVNLILANADNIDSENPEFAGELGAGFVNPVEIFQALKIELAESRLIKGSDDAVYYQAVDGKRYVFPDAKTYFSWYDDFSRVEIISDEELAAIPIGGNVTMRPGVKLVKIKSTPEVYAVAKGGVLRWIKTEEIAQFLYGKDWMNSVVDISDAFFVNYKFGEIIDNLDDFNPFLVKESVVSIDLDKGLIK